MMKGVRRGLLFSRDWFCDSERAALENQLGRTGMIFLASIEAKVDDDLDDECYGDRTLWLSV